MWVVDYYTCEKKLHAQAPKSTSVWDKIKDWIRDGNNKYPLKVKAKRVKFIKLI